MGGVCRRGMHRVDNGNGGISSGRVFEKPIEKLQNEEGEGRESQISSYVSCSLKNIYQAGNYRSEGCFSWLKEKIYGGGKVVVSESVSLEQETVSFGQRLKPLNGGMSFKQLFSAKVQIDTPTEQSSDTSSSPMIDKLQFLKREILAISSPGQVLGLKDQMLVIAELREVKDEIEPNDFWAKKLYSECEEAVIALKLPVKIRAQLTSSKSDLNEEVIWIADYLDKENPRIKDLTSSLKKIKLVTKSADVAIKERSEVISELEAKKGRIAGALSGDKKRLTSRTSQLTPKEAKSLQESVDAREARLKNVEFDLVVEDKKLKSCYRNCNTEVVSSFSELPLAEVEFLLEASKKMEVDTARSFKALAEGRKNGQIEESEYAKLRQEHLELKEAYLEISSILTACTKGDVIVGVDRKGNTVLSLDVNGAISTLKVSENSRLADEVSKHLKGLLESQIERVLVLE